MNIFGFRPFKGKFNLGDSDDIPENQDGTLIGSVKQINTALVKPTKVAEATANQTYAAQLTSLKSTFDNLNNVQKANAYLVLGNGNVYKCMSTNGVFEALSSNTPQTSLSSMRVNDSKFYQSLINVTDSSVTFVDSSSTNNTTVMELWTLS